VIIPKQNGKLIPPKQPSPPFAPGGRNSANIAVIPGTILPSVVNLDPFCQGFSSNL
jgi:hypothetical protein